jgi:hypothetical protein
VKQALERLLMSAPSHEKSIAKPCSCMELPGRAVGGEHCEEGIS